MEIKLVNNGSFFIGHSPYSRYSCPSLCRDALRRVVDLPRGCKMVYAVFTKTDTRPDATFTIKPTIKIARTQYAIVEETGAVLLWGVRDLLGAAYQRGYRYVRFETDE